MTDIGCEVIGSVVWCRVMTFNLIHLASGAAGVDKFCGSAGVDKFCGVAGDDKYCGVTDGDKCCGVAAGHK